MYGDTLTWGDRGLGMWSGDCQSNSGVRGYSDMGGDRNVVQGLSE